MRASAGLMRFLVWNMRWTTRYAGFAARPIVRAYAKVEVIACGLRERDRATAVIYTPAPGRGRHCAQVHEGRRWRPAVSLTAPDLSTPVVHRLFVPDARIGARYRVRATNRLGWRLSSPAITIKDVTEYPAALLAITPAAGGSVTISWQAAEAYDPMIYFLALEDDSGQNIAAIYTREISWTYPRTKTASLSVGPARPPRLVPGASYTAKLVVVDYEGWAGHFAEQSFTV